MQIFTLIHPTPFSKLSSTNLMKPPPSKQEQKIPSNSQVTEDNQNIIASHEHLLRISAHIARHQSEQKIALARIVHPHNAVVAGRHHPLPTQLEAIHRGRPRPDRRHALALLHRPDLDEPLLVTAARDKATIRIERTDRMFVALEQRQHKVNSLAPIELQVLASVVHFAPLVQLFQGLGVKLKVNGTWCDAADGW